MHHPISPDQVRAELDYRADRIRADLAIRRVRRARARRAGARLITRR